MNLFRKKNTPSPQEQLAVKPVRLVEATMELAADGSGKLKVPLRPSRLRIFRMPPGATKTFEFDALGAMVWSHCDGKTTVKQIINKMAKRYNLTLREAQMPTQAFLGMLAKRGLVGIGPKETSTKDK